MRCPGFRTKLEDPQYSGFFLHFNHSATNVPQCDSTYSPPKCSTLYHDQTQTPGIAPGSDGICTDLCDCGKVPCGFYLFNHLNGSMIRRWLVEEYILGSTGVGSASIDGVFLDDYWCYQLGPTPECKEAGGATRALQPVLELTRARARG